ncbi:MAG: VOC family protein [Planctomycetota bacterium]|jgi:predicted enzyme related to lactoylglutathione lyase
MAEATQTPPAVGTFCWNEVLTRDVAQCKGFYTKLFDWTTDEMDMGGGNMYTMFKSGDTHTGGCMKMDGPQFENVPPHWLAYIAVDDVDACAKQAESLGGKVCCPPTDLPVGRFAIIQDPGGAVFGVWKSKQ